ncbi:MAG: alanine racemase [Actinomycetia bacterium]|nr:alanine racemase [Actinomycetes bacterium]
MTDDPARSAPQARSAQPVPSALVFVGPRTKGLRLSRDHRLDELRAQLAIQPRRVDDDWFGWPLLTLDDAALSHNIDTMAGLCRDHGLWHAPHVKTPMSADLWLRQAAAGAWAATVAMPHQLRAARDWGARRVLLANELVDLRDARWLVAELDRDPLFQVWLEVDSDAGISVLASALAGASADVRARLRPLVEVGVPGGRTGARTAEQAVALTRRLIAERLRVDGVIGFEGTVAPDASAASLGAVRDWVETLLAIAREVERASAQWRAACPSGPIDPFLVSVGGSAYLDVVAPALAALPARGWQGVLRSGAYLTHDHVHYAELNPWSRLPDGRRLDPAITIWAQVLSVPEPGLALLGAGRRDVPYDLDAPVPLWWRRPAAHGRLGAPTLFHQTARVRGFDDQHAFLVLDDRPAPLAVGDVVGLGISHPCTAFDKWRLAAVTRGDDVIDLYPLDF